jgi:hypothetical protein
MILGPCVGYIIQCFKMTKERNADGFSPFICLILLVANIVRVFWWFAEEFSPVLLVASLVMIACQMCLLYLWVTIK